MKVKGKESKKRTESLKVIKGHYESMGVHDEITYSV